MDSSNSLHADISPHHSSVSAYRSLPDVDDDLFDLNNPECDHVGSLNGTISTNSLDFNQPQAHIRGPGLSSSATSSDDEYSSLMEQREATDDSQASCTVGGFFAKLYLYIQHALREANKRKCQYFLAFFSVFLVVFVAGAALSVSTRAPVIFLNQAEGKAGQVDFRMISRHNNLRYLNYSLVEEVGKAHTELSLSSPRYYSPKQGMIYHRKCVDMVKEAGFDPSVEAENNDWMYIGNEDLAVECPPTNYDSCLGEICDETPSTRSSFTLVLINSEKEKAMGAGRDWDYGTIPAGEAIISARMADEMGLKQGDTFFATLNDFNDLEDLFIYQSAPLQKTVLLETLRRQIPEEELAANVNINTTQILQAAVNSFSAYTELPLRVFAITKRGLGKFADDDMVEQLVMEMDSFMSYFARKVNPSLRSRDLEYLASVSIPQFVADDCPVKVLPWSPAELFALAGAKNTLSHFSTEVILNIYGDRISPYLSSSYQKIHEAVTQIGGNVAYRFGFSELRVLPVLLEEVEPLKMFSMFLDLILSVVLTVLFVLSFMLIYSLLTISVETRTFELGVHRMTGIKRRGIIEMLCVQAFSYSIPGVIVGLVIAQIATSAVMRIFENSLGVPLPSGLTSTSLIVAIILGLLLPLVASVFPIQSALSQNLHDVLDSEHSKQVGVQFTIERSQDDGSSFALMVVGLGMTIFGFCIYYLLPLSLLSMNLALFFNIFFGILLGILFGLVLLSFNVQHLVERLVVFCCLFWEKSFINDIVLKNLVSHKVRNRKTSMMYALSLGFILFIVMALTTELKNSSASKAKEYGANIAIVFQNTASRSKGFIYNGELELEASLSSPKFSHIVRSWAWVGTDFSNYSENIIIDQSDKSAETQNTLPVYRDIRMSNRGRTLERSLQLLAVGPGYLDTAFEEFYAPTLVNRATQLSPTEQLYTLRGSQSALVSAALAEDYLVRSVDTNQRGTVLSFQDNTHGEFKTFASSSLAILNSLAGMSMTKFRTSSAQPYVMSFPALMAMSTGRFTDTGSLPMGKLIVRLHDNVPKKERQALMAELRSTARSLQFGGVGLSIKEEKSSESTDSMENVLMLVFGFAAFLCMFLCMFSLIASMYSNIYESAREIGVLRAIGLTAAQVTRVYIYEAFALVMASSLIGVVIGIMIGWSIMLFRVLFTQLPLAFSFPWSTLVAVIAAAIVCSFISAWSPIRALNRKSIAGIFRTFY